MNWLIGLVVLVAILLACIGWACVKVGADSERRNAKQQDEHRDGLPL